MPKSKTTGQAIGISDSESVSVSIRAIENGFLITKATSGPKGYECTDTYSPTKPKLDIPAAAPAKKAAPKKSGRVARQGYR